MIPLPSCQVMLDDRRADSNDKYPVVLYLYFNKKKKLYPVGIKLTQLEWDNSRKKKPLEEFKDKKEKIDTLEYKAKKIVEELDDVFSFERFEQKWNEKGLSGLTVREICASIGQTKRTHSTKRGYALAGISLDNFKKGVTLKDITVEFLKDYEKWMTDNGNSKTTVGIYLRNIRAIIKKDENLDKRNYPFGSGDDKYSIPKGAKGKTKNKPLNLDEIELIINYVPNTERLKKYKAFWLMIYFGNGINPKDVCRLKYKNIHDEEIRFIRAKTEYTIKQDPPEIIVYINEEIKHVIDTYGQGGDEDDYIFPILEKNVQLESEDEWRRIYNFVKAINECMEEIRKAIKITKKVKTYTARRSYGTNLIKQGTNPIFVQQQFGHMSLSTTEDYIGEFNSIEIKKESQKLKPNKKSKKLKPNKKPES